MKRKPYPVSIYRAKSYRMNIENAEQEIIEKYKRKSKCDKEKERNENINGEGTQEADERR